LHRKGRGKKEIEENKEKNSSSANPDVIWKSVNQSNSTTTSTIQAITKQLGTDK